MNGLIGRWEAAGVRVREKQAERADEMVFRSLDGRHRSLGSRQGMVGWK